MQCQYTHFLVKTVNQPQGIMSRLSRDARVHEIDDEDPTEDEPLARDKSCQCQIGCSCNHLAFQVTLKDPQPERTPLLNKRSPRSSFHPHVAFQSPEMTQANRFPSQLERKSSNQENDPQEKICPCTLNAKSSAPDEARKASLEERSFNIPLETRYSSTARLGDTSLEEKPCPCRFGKAPISASRQDNSETQGASNHQTLSQHLAASQQDTAMSTHRELSQYQTQSQQDRATSNYQTLSQQDRATSNHQTQSQPWSQEERAASRYHTLIQQDKATSNTVDHLSESEVSPSSQSVYRVKTTTQHRNKPDASSGSTGSIPRLPAPLFIDDLPGEPADDYSYKYKSGKTIFNPESRDVVAQLSTKLDPSRESGIRKSGIKESGIRELGIRESGIRESGIRESGIRESGIRESGIREPGIRESGIRESGIRESGIREFVIRDSGIRESGIREPGIRESGIRESGIREPVIREFVIRDSGIRESEIQQSELRGSGLRGLGALDLGQNTSQGKAERDHQPKDGEGQRRLSLNQTSNSPSVPQVSTTGRITHDQERDRELKLSQDNYPFYCSRQTSGTQVQGQGNHFHIKRLSPQTSPTVSRRLPSPTLSRRLPSPEGSKICEIKPCLKSRPRYQAICQHCTPTQDSGQHCPPRAEDSGQQCPKAGVSTQHYPRAFRLSDRESPKHNSCSSTRVCVEGCAKTCPGTCSGACQKTCPGACPKTCPGACPKTCPGACPKTCSRTCQGACPRTCTGACPRTCTGACPRTCTGACPKTCPGACPKTCPGTCPKTCSRTCSGACPKTCPGACSKTCSGACPKTCSGARPKTCPGACPRACSDSCANSTAPSQPRDEHRQHHTCSEHTTRCQRSALSCACSSVNPGEAERSGRTTTHSSTSSGEADTCSHQQTSPGHVVVKKYPRGRQKPYTYCVGNNSRPCYDTPNTFTVDYMRECKMAEVINTPERDHTITIAVKKTPPAENVAVKPFVWNSENGVIRAARVGRPAGCPSHHRRKTEKKPSPAPSARELNQKQHSITIQERAPRQPTPHQVKPCEMNPPVMGGVTPSLVGRMSPCMMAYPRAALCYSGKSNTTRINAKHHEHFAPSLC